MATERLNIVVTENGSRVVRRNIEDIGGAAKTTTSALDFLKRALAGIGVAVLVRELTQYADAYTQVINRLKLATDSTEQLKSVEQELFAVSQETRTSLSANAQLYGRLSIAAKELGASQETLLDFTRGVGLALAVSGQSAESASGALLQLSQAVGAGIVRAEEFNSILEGAPRIAQAVADGLDRAGGSVARLRKEVIEGNLQSREFFEALLSQIPKLEKEFGETSSTIGQAFQVLQNSITRAVGQIDQELGVSGGAGRLIIEFSRTLEDLVPIIITFGQEFSEFGRQFGEIIRAMGTDTSTFGQNLDRDIRSWINLWDNYAAGVRTAVAIIQDIFEKGIDFDNFFGGPGGGRGADDPALDPAALFNQFKAKGIGAAIDRSNINLTQRFRGFNQGPEFEPINTSSTAAADNTKQLEKERTELDRLVRSIDSVEDAKRTLAETEAVLSREQIKGAISIQEMMRLLDIQRQQLDDQLNPLEAINEELDHQVSLMGLSNREQEIQNQLREIQTQLLSAGVELSDEELEILRGKLATLFDLSEVQERYNQELQKTNAVLNSITGPASEYADTIRILNDLLADGRITAEEHFGAMRNALISYLDTQEEMGAGIARGLLKLQKEYTDFASIAENAVRDAFKGAEDAIVEFAKTGKFEFSNFIDSLIEDIIRLQLRAFFGQVLTGVTNSLIGSFGSGGNTPEALGTVGQPGANPASFGGHSGRGPGEFFQTRLIANMLASALPRHHNGVGPGEHAAVIRNDESVLTPGQMRALSGMGGKSINVSIYENSSNTQVTTEERQNQFGEPELKVMIDDINAKNMATRGTRTESVLRYRYNARNRLATR